ncbi:MAG: nickel-dependent hydrogenase large subunit [Neomegalonema sp.]|nr:nickel-dependent hydrogenase large subunit [Neomegalonema sp.]
MSRIIMGPFNRVEGDLEVKLDIEAGAVAKAHVVSPLYRGFERMMIGKRPADALVFTPRICGICSVSQSVAAAKALADAQGATPPPNGQLAINLVHATENVADHLTHFYLFFMPDFARPTYAAEPWSASTVERFAALKGEAAREVLPARAQLMHLMGLLAGKWPHTLSIQPGGSTRAVVNSELARISGILAGFLRFLEKTLFGDKLERVAALKSADELGAWAAEKPADSSDFRRFLALSDALRLTQLGRVNAPLLSFGAYEDEDGVRFARGVFDQGAVREVDAAAIAEDTSHVWDLGGGALPPFEGRTQPDPEQKSGYTWCKAPRLGGRVAETGAVARQAVDGHPLVRDLLTDGATNVHSRVVARLLEIARVTIAMEGWARRINPKEPFRTHGQPPKEALGMGLTEAARGALGHWIKIERGKIANYQIIAPTTWNFSPRDADGQPGALEQALVGAPVRAGETEPVAAQHVVRSFDPCVVCTVH